MASHRPFNHILLQRACVLCLCNTLLPGRRHHRRRRWSPRCAAGCGAAAGGAASAAASAGAARRGARWPRSTPPEESSSRTANYGDSQGTLSMPHTSGHTSLPGAFSRAHTRIIIFNCQFIFEWRFSYFSPNLTGIFFNAIIEFKFGCPDNCFGKLGIFQSWKET